MKSLLRFLLFCALASALTGGVSYIRDRSEHHALVTRGLDESCTRVALVDGKVQLVPGRRGRWMRTMQRGHADSFLLPVGGRFQSKGHHGGTVYTIESIEADGVKLRYVSDGYFKHSSFFPSHFRGTAKLHWK